MPYFIFEFMKRFLLISVLYPFSILFAQYQVEYAVSHRRDSLMPKEAVQPYIFTLYIENGKTLYASKARIVSDSMRSSIRKSGNVFNIMMPSIRGPKGEYITSNLNEKKIEQHLRIEDANFIYTSDFPKNYILKNEVKKIEGLTANSAQIDLSGRRYTVWYTREIPISAGPFKFYGLPGLVLSAQDESGDVKFEVVSIKKLDAPTPTEVFELTSNERIIESYPKYLQAYKSYEHAPPSKMLMDVMTEESRKRWEDNYKQRLRTANNFIER